MGASRPHSPVPSPALLERLGFAATDLATRDKIPVVRALLSPDGEGLALDIGIGTGYTTHGVFGNRPTVCVDLDPDNLRAFRAHAEAVRGLDPPMCVVAEATALPFRRETFRFVLSSEVLEHLEDDGGAAAEIARVLHPGGRAAITVPYTGIGFAGFLELLGVKTVHDFPGPERHVRPGYDERALGDLFRPHGLGVIGRAFYFRFFTRAAADLVSLLHLTYQRLVHRRRAWTWSDAAAAEGGAAFAVYRRLFPVLRAFGALDRLLASCRGFGLVALIARDEVTEPAERPRAAAAERMA